MVNFYRDLWEKRAHHIAPINDLTKNKKKGPIVWSPEAETAFENIKKIVAEDDMMHYPGFNQVFEIHTNSSDYQMGAIISQMGIRWHTGLRNYQIYKISIQQLIKNYLQL